MVLGCESSTKSQPQHPTALKTLYHDDFLNGTALSETLIQNQDSMIKSIVLEQFNTIAPENVMKAERINPEPNVYNFESVEES